MGEKAMTPSNEERSLSGFIDDVLRPSIENLTRRFLDGLLELDAWQKAVAGELKQAHIVASILGRGGRDRMTYADWGRVGGRLRSEFRFLDNFAREILGGKLTAAQILARAGAYIDAARQSFFSAKTTSETEDGAEWEQRFLGASESCDDCVRYAAMGRQPIGTLPEPGERSICGNNCQCVKIYGRDSGDV